MGVGLEVPDMTIEGMVGRCVLLNTALGYYELTNPVEISQSEQWLVPRTIS
jgi:hypothetical protein